MFQTVPHTLFAPSPFLTLSATARSEYAAKGRAGMIIHVAFWVLLAWAVYDNELYPMEAAIYAGIWLAFLVGFWLLKVPPMWFMVPSVLLDIVLIFKLFGGNLRVR